MPVFASDATQKVAELFHKKPVLEMRALERAAGGRSRRSLFRDLDALGYLSSYTHTGRFYTLASLPDFDSGSERAFIIRYSLWSRASSCAASQLRPSTCTWPLYGHGQRSSSSVAVRQRPPVRRPVTRQRQRSRSRCWPR